MNDRQVQGKENAAQITGNAKIASTHIQGADAHVKEVIAGQAQIVKQQIANDKKEEKKDKK